MKTKLSIAVLLVLALTAPLAGAAGAQGPAESLVLSAVARMGTAQGPA